MSLSKIDWTHAGWHAQENTARDAAPFVERLQRELPVLPFLSLPFAEELCTSLEEQAEFLLGFRHMLLLGIGGSALGPRALQKAFAPGQDRPGHEGRSLWIADNVHPEWLHDHLQKLDPEETIVVVVSKSGGTIETIAQYLLVLPWLKQALPSTWQNHLFMITDAKEGFLRREAEACGIRTLPVPDHLGGRYSALSAVGLVPALFLGIDWKALLDGALSVGRPLANAPEELPRHPAWKLALWAESMAKEGRSQIIFFTYIPEWSSFGPWFCQLWAESLGKEGKGTMPLPAVGVTDQHSLLQMFLDGPKDKSCLFVNAPAATSLLPLPDQLPEAWSFLENTSFGHILEAESFATRATLALEDVPLVGIDMADSGPFAAGKMMMLLEAATIFTGWLLGVNPVDQPAVEHGKKLALARLGAAGGEAAAASLTKVLDVPQIRESF